MTTEEKWDLCVRLYDRLLDRNAALEKEVAELKAEIAKLEAENTDLEWELMGICQKHQRCDQSSRASTGASAL